MVVPIPVFSNVVDGLLHFLRVRVGKGEIMAEGGTPEGGEDDEGNHRQQGRDSKMAAELLFQREHENNTVKKEEK